MVYCLIPGDSTPFGVVFCAEIGMGSVDGKDRTARPGTGSLGTQA
jgi:hypothetical protein